ncbi:MAG: cytochrome c-type biogenesis protein CcmH [Gammaproteobacteria bacterium]|nr:cytochrome c-type biogenesis protein CcmH [Gammaproteobacteria bacterium]MBT8149916.1 cytochrome c-type biogenesis protein CcmH [Gammaproteobacteria bacterium]NND38352.1 cytochrome c-type biogenesis protein CcmH [Pseudomonadales bacterium]NNM12342.1 cytochrome c-type biogenesis protein CcmH [Pseudomonadales bacterium]RZV60173.1 MAG: cytochrome c-type biogenesis protein CcmH [Pseudomonadales bacterium]
MFAGLSLYTPFALAVETGTTPAALTAQTAQANESAASAQTLRRFAAPVLEKRYYALLDELRCPKCQNQNLADSDAPIAADLRDELFRLLHENYNDGQIKEYMVARFGSFVLYSPPASGYTAVLWVLPGLLFIGAAVLIWRVTGSHGQRSLNSQASHREHKPAGSRDA